MQWQHSHPSGRAWLPPEAQTDKIKNPKPKAKNITPRGHAKTNKIVYP